MHQLLEIDLAGIPACRLQQRAMSSTNEANLPLVSPEAVLERLAVILREVIGEAWADDVPIGPETSFNRDLELESIEFVSLSERLQTEYGRKVFRTSACPAERHSASQTRLEHAAASTSDR